MPSMNQKVSSFLLEQKEFITEDCVKAMITLYERGPMNISFLADSIDLKQHKMTPIIAVIEAFGFVELYKAGQSKEYNITDFGADYLKQQNLLSKKEETITNSTILEQKESYVVNEDMLPRILRLVLIGKRNSIEEIAETIEVGNKEVKKVLQQLTLSKMVENTFKNQVRRYQLTKLGDLFYQFMRKQENGQEVLEELKNEVPHLYETLIGLTNGKILYEEEYTYALTLGLAYSDNSSVSLTELGKLLLKSNG